VDLDRGQDLLAPVLELVLEEQEHLGKMVLLLLVLSMLRVNAEMVNFVNSHISIKKVTILDTPMS
jgi:hypothetical protein